MLIPKTDPNATQVENRYENALEQLQHACCRVQQKGEAPAQLYIDLERLHKVQDEIRSILGLIEKEEPKTYLEIFGGKRVVREGFTNLVKWLGDELSREFTIEDLIRAEIATTRKELSYGRSSYSSMPRRKNCRSDSSNKEYTATTALISGLLNLGLVKKVESRPFFGTEPKDTRLHSVYSLTELGQTIAKQITNQ